MKSSTRASATPLHEFFGTEEEIFTLNWQEHFSVDTLNKHYIPQGLIHDEDVIYHSIHKRNKKSILIIFDVKSQTYQPLCQLVLPHEATHTSDLTIYKNKFYAIDYHSNYIYEFDLAGLQKGTQARLVLKNRVRAQFENLKFGSLEIVLHDDTEYLLLTSFGNDNRLFVLDFRKFFDDLEGFESALVFSIAASYFTQGLYFDVQKNFLYHSVNRFNKDFIYELDVLTLLNKKSYEEAISRVFLGPGPMIEDLSVQSNVVHTSDEKTMGIYSASFDSSRAVSDYNFNDISDTKYYEKLLSHRARVRDFEENTLDALSEVLSTNVKYIEIDIRFSSDGTAFAYHDPHFTSGRKKFRFSERTWKEISEYRYRHKDMKISTLEDILEHFAKHKKEGQILAIDIKDFGFEEKLFELFKKHDLLESIIVFTWTPQTIFALDEIFQKRGVSFPLYLSHVRTDSIFTFLGLPWFLNYRGYFLNLGPLVLIGQKNYKTPLGKYALGYLHVPYFRTLPRDLVAVLKRYNGGICVTKKTGTWGDRHLKKLKAQGLKVTVFGAFFGYFRINTKEAFEYEAKKPFIDIVFMDDLSRIPD
jgi:hypothetical protein